MPDDLSAFQPELPEAVRRAAARSEELVRSIGEGGTPDPVPPTVGEGTEGEQPPLAERTPPSGASGTQPEPTPAATPAPADDWQQRYNTLKGKYDSEVPELRGTVRAMQGQLEGLQNLLTTVRSMPAPTPAPSPVAPPAADPVPEQDVSDYGELVPKSQTWARAAVAPELAVLRQEIAQIRSASQINTTAVQETQGTIAKQSVETHLDGAVPGWQAINNNPAFTAWLQEVDPFSERIRHDMLGEAYVSGNGPRTAKFFRAFQTEQTAVNPAPGTPSAHTPNGADRIPLEDLVAPGRGTTTPQSQGAPQGKRMWSRDQIAAHFEDVRRGRFRGREAAQLALEQDMTAAASEGRVH